MEEEAGPWKGALAGMAGGLVASFVMNEFQVGLAKLKPRREAPGDAPSDEPATVKAAAKVLGRPLKEEEKGLAGNLVHYLFGTAVGGIYGLLAEENPAARAGYGVAFGSALWLVSDEIAVPALGLAKGPRSYPVSVHASALASHVVYGAATELVRAGLRAM